MSYSPIRRFSIAGEENCFVHGPVRRRNSLFDETPNLSNVLLLQRVQRIISAVKKDNSLRRRPSCLLKAARTGWDLSKYFFTFFLFTENKTLRSQFERLINLSGMNTEEIEAVLGCDYRV